MFTEDVDWVEKTMITGRHWKRYVNMLPGMLLAGLLVACGSGGSGPDTGGSAGPVDPCPALPPPPAGARIISVTPADSANLASIVAAVTAGDTIEFASGIYDLAGQSLSVTVPDVTLRSRSGNRDDVVLDGNGLSNVLVFISAGGVTVADMTLRNATLLGIHVGADDSADGDARIYNVHIADTGEWAVKTGPVVPGNYPDNGELACSHLELTAAGRIRAELTGYCLVGGFEGQQVQGWVIRDNRIEGFWCNNAMAPPAVFCWKGCRDTRIERNRLSNNATAISLGLRDSGSARSYSDNPCPSAGGLYVEHYGGVVRNNFIFAGDAGFLSSLNGFECGVCLRSACEASVVHNTVYSAGANFSSIEWRYPTSTGIRVYNNIASHALRERSGALADSQANLTGATASLFIDAAAGDLHLDATAVTAIDQGMALPAGLADDDIDSQARDATPDIGADELR